jgi:uncharacterized repeat protein (TIGR03803 family)
MRKTLLFVCLLALSNLILFAQTGEIRLAQAPTETVIYNFAGTPDGALPESGLTARDGNFYGATESGGAFGYGTVFELSPNGSGGWNESVLYSFTGGADGSEPVGWLIFDSVGNLYGTTSLGGANGLGEVFELSPAGSSWAETVLYSFANDGDGAEPETGLILDAAGNLYGTTGYYAGGDGTVFELSLSAGNWTEQTIYSFSGYSGNIPGLTMDGAGNLYGTTTDNVFKLSPNGKGGWNATLIHTFVGGTKDGSAPEGNLALDHAGNVYGATYYGGKSNDGTVYKLTPVTTGKKKGTYTNKILYTFKGGTKDGYAPEAGVVLDAAGNLYGTAFDGGKYNGGIVYELVAPAAGKTAYTKKILWVFNLADGNGPFGGALILDGSGNLYGTTIGGGSSGSGCGGYGCGVVFEVTP